MGTSTDGILFYGYCWDDEASERQLDIVSASQEADLASAHRSPCVIGTHCSAEAPMLFVAVGDSLTKAWRGHPREISSLFVDPRWDPHLAEFCRSIGIDTNGKKATWWLVSDWT